MRLSAIKQASSDVVEITSSDGPVFFIRTAYLTSIKPEEIVAGAEFFEDREEEIIDAGLAFAAERKAEDLLARCEQCRAGLTKKLLRKGHLKKAVEQALDWLESRKLLDDRRFSFSWLRSHTVSKPQGRIRLLSELCARGIKTEDAKAALNDFFEQTDENELCRRAFEKAVRLGKSEEKLVKYMVDSGFSYKMVIQLKDEIK